VKTYECLRNGDDLEHVNGLTLGRPEQRCQGTQCLPRDCIETGDLAFVGRRSRTRALCPSETDKGRSTLSSSARGSGRRLPWSRGGAGGESPRRATSNGCYFPSSRAPAAT
jgi:hypothetical protein